MAPTDYSNVRIIDMARALEEIGRTGSSSRKSNMPPAGIENWTRCFSVELVEQPLARHGRLSGESDWQVLASPEHPLTAALQQRFAACPGSGVIVALQPKADERSIGLLLDGARAAIARKGAGYFVLVQHGQERRHSPAPSPRSALGATCVITLPLHHPRSLDGIVDEVGRQEDSLKPTTIRRAGDAFPPATHAGSRRTRRESLDSTDVILVTGGGKGIAAECAISLARQTGARLAIMGRSHPELDAELRANLNV